MKRKRYTEEQIIRLLKEHEAGVTIEELARRHGVAKSSLQRWKSKYGGIEVSEVRRLRELEFENARLKKLLAVTMLEKTAIAAGNHFADVNTDGVASPGPRATIAEP